MKELKETLEEAAEDFANSKKWMDGGVSEWVQHIFKEGAEWQAERMYSEEEVKEIILDAINSCTDGMSSHNQDFKEWFEENKKK